MPKLRIFISFLVVLFGLTAATKATAADELKIAYNVGVAPLKFEDAASRPTGLFPDLWRLWAQKAGSKIEFVRADSFEESLQLLKDGKVDLHAGLFRTPEREEFLDYSEPLLTLDYYIFTHPSVHPIISLEKTAGFLVGVQKGGYTEQLVCAKVPGNRIATYDRFQELLQAALEGEIRVFVATELSLFYYLKENYLTNIFEHDRDRPLYSQEYYTATKKGNPALIQQVNDGLKAIGSQERKQLEDKWIVRDFQDVPQKSPTAPAGKDKLSLTDAEERWLDTHPVIRVSNEPDYAPFDFIEYGKPRGLSIDYMNLVAEQLGIKVEYVTGPSWNEFLGMVKRKELDVMLNIVKTEDRMKYLLYTDPYVKNPNVIVSSQASPYETIQTLFGKTVAFPKGFFYEEVLTKSFPQIKRLPVGDTLASLKAVAFGRADAALGEAAVVRTLINKNFIAGLQISGEVNIGDPDLMNLRIGVRDDWPLLHSALMKAMAAITPQEMNQIQQKWMVAASDTTVAPQTAATFSYGRLVIYGIAVFLALSLLAWILIKTIKKENIAVSFGSRWFRGLVLAGLSIFIIIVSLLGWFMLEKTKKDILADVAENLTGILNTADERINLWVEQRTSFLKLLGRDPELVTLIKRLLAVKPDRESLLASDALRETRAFFKTNKQIFANIGFFIINTDDISIGSMRDTNIGTPSLISLQRPDLLRRAFEGEVLFVPPIESDVPLVDGPKADKARNPSTKFFIGPIQDPNGQIIAIMTLRVDPSEDLSRVLTSFETRKSFETYAFNEHGELLSESRFNEQLRRIGLIGEDQRSAANIVIRDPGVNLVKGLQSKIERSQQPLTRMVSRAVQLKLDMEKAGQTYGHSKIEIDAKGYRDYRGVPVFGSWLWNADLELGLATEIDVAEALANYYQVRRTVFVILGFTLFLSVGTVLLVLILGERTSHALMRARDNLEAKVDERTAELQEKQVQLEEAVERSGLLLDSAGEGIFGVDLEGSVAFINPAANRMLGYSADEIIGQDVHEKIHHSHADGSGYPKETCPMYLSHIDGTDHHVTDEVLWRKDGTPFPVEYTSMPIKKNGRVVGAVVTFMDITERKQYEKALGESQRQLQSMIDNVPGVVYRCLAKHPWSMLSISDGVQELVGYPASDYLGESPVRIFGSHIHPDDIEETSRIIQKAINKNKPYVVEYRVLNVSNEIRYVHAKGKAVIDAAGIPKYLDGAIFDITDRKRLEEENQKRIQDLDKAHSSMLQMMEDLDEEKEKAEAATRAKSDFLANMSHEIRTPMNAVVGMAHLALKTELTPKQQDYLNKIQLSANSLLGIINDILDFSKIEAGKLDMEAAEFDLLETLDNVANVITVKARQKENLEVLFYIDSQVDNFLVGDSLRLNQILVNLGNNAIKFTEQGEIVLSARVKQRLDDKVTLQFSVRDTGIGMTEEQQNKLFQAFSQADTSTTRKYGGTGLGLTISKRLVNLMGGEIWIESEPGRGTTFNFTADFGLGKETVKRRFEPSPDLRGLKVLVVDDNATSREILQDILESFTFEVILSASGKEALEEIERADNYKPFELVIMDWKMPGMGGIEASRRIKNHRKLTKIPAIVLVTAYGREEIMMQADEIGLEGFLLKPVNSSVMFDAIMQALGKEVQDEVQAGRKKEQNNEELSAISGARVLLVEDNEINQQVAQEILQGAGLIVTVVNNGQEGVDAAKQNHYDAILMDIQMPVMDGYEATKRIRNSECGMRNEKGKNSDIKSQTPNPKSQIEGVPIIAMTAHAMAGDEQKSLDAGMNGHVTKPIDPALLFAALQKWIKPGDKPIEGQQAQAFTQHPEPDQTEPNEEALPESLPGFDIDAGLKRLLGNKHLYRKLLVDFGTKYTETAGKIGEALDAKDFERVHSLVHNLKGLAGNLEAKDLQAATVEMERLVKGQAEKTVSDKELRQKFAALENALEQALDAVQTLGPAAEKKTVENSADMRASVPPELLNQATESIKAAAEMGDVTQIKSIAEELKSESEAMAPFCDELVRLAEDFDFDGIQKFLR